MSIKTAALAFLAMAGMGTAAPVAAYYSNGYQDEPARLLSVAKPMAPPAFLRAAPEAAAIEVVLTPARISAALPPPKAAPVKPQCSWHNSETLATGKVWVCDVARTGNERPTGTFRIEKKNAHLAPRDTPSPSGFIE